MSDALWTEGDPDAEEGDPGYVRYNASEYRQFLHAITGGMEGVWPSTGLKVSQRGAGANGTVDVATGSGIVASTEATRESYFQSFGTVTNLAIPAQHASGATKHLVGLRIQDAEESGTEWGGALAVISGTLGANTDPTQPENFYPLARVTRPGGSPGNNVTDAMITDLRTRVTMLGGTIFCTSTTRPTGIVEGQEIYETNTSRTYKWDGSAWIYQHGGIQPLFAARMYIASAYTSPNATEKIVPFDTVGHDFNGDASTGVSAHYTVPVSGLFDVRAMLTFGYNNARQLGTLLLRADSSEKSRISNTWGSGLTTSDPCGLTLVDQVAFVAGEQITLRFTPSGSSSNAVQVTDAFLELRRV